MRYLPLVVALGLMIYTIIDVARSEPEERNGISRPLWMALIVLLPVIGSVVWLVARQNARARGAGGSGGRGTGGGGGGGSRPRPSRPGPVRPSGPVAPDDDPEFLWRLAQQQRRAQQERGGAAQRPDGPDAAPGAGTGDSGGDSPGHGGTGPRTKP